MEYMLKIWDSSCFILSFMLWQCCVLMMWLGFRTKTFLTRLGKDSVTTNMAENGWKCLNVSSKVPSFRTVIFCWNCPAVSCFKVAKHCLEQWFLINNAQWFHADKCWNSLRKRSNIWATSPSKVYARRCSQTWVKSNFVCFMMRCSPEHPTWKRRAGRVVKAMDCVGSNPNLVTLRVWGDLNQPSSHVNHVTITDIQGTFLILTWSRHLLHSLFRYVCPSGVSSH